MPNGIATDRIPEALASAAARVPWIILVPSPQLQEPKEKRDDIVLDVVFSQIIKGRPRKIAPAYVSREYLEYAPLLVGTRMGMFLDGDSEQGVGFEKEWFLNQVPRMIGEMKTSGQADLK